MEYTISKLEEKFHDTFYARHLNKKPIPNKSAWADTVGTNPYLINNAFLKLSIICLPVTTSLADKR